MTSLHQLPPLCLGLALLAGVAHGQDAPTPAPSFAELKVQGAAGSTYRQGGGIAELDADATATPDLDGFRRDIEPVLARSCVPCHGPEEDEAGLRIDELDPNLFEGLDADWWIEVLAKLNNGEMPPKDEDVELADADRSTVVEWLARESQRASNARRGTREHTSFRRMTRYEFGYALQDLLGLPFDFAADLPPDPVGDDGFQKSSEVLHLTGSQFRTYLEANRRALDLATVSGPQPAPLHWSVSMAQAAAREWAKQDAQLDKLREQHADDPETLATELEKRLEAFRKRPGGVYFVDPATGRKAHQSWGYNGASYAWAPVDTRPEPPAVAEQYAIVPPRQSLIVELGDRIPERGTLRVRVRAARATPGAEPAPRMKLVFGWQASNDSRAFVTVSEHDLVVDADPEAPRWFQWDVPLSQVYPRNLVRGINELGDLPSPSEYVRIAHASGGGDAIRIDHVEVAAPVYDTWPPASHATIFGDGRGERTETDYARDVIGGFMARAWRRAVTDAEVAQKLALFERLRDHCDTAEAAILEVLAGVLTSPHFLYLVEADAAHEADEATELTDTELATRLSMLVWCSIPDDELRAVANAGSLRDPEVLARQVDRMLADPRARRFSEQFVRQWLNLELLEFLQVDAELYPHFDGELKRAMLEEPVAFFDELLRIDASALDLLHADFTMLNERLARHYGRDDVLGSDFRRVDLAPGQPRGGLLTQAGLLAMNSNGVDSHPIKRGVWLLERILNDPPPPPPPAVPEIDLADPEIAKLTFKQRLEQHRDHAACMSCHAKIDPWGFVFENFDAVGSWRTERGGKPVDAVGELFDGRELDGIDGLKRFLLGERQDQFVRAVVDKLATFALGRPLSFGDRAALDRITSTVRQQGDGLATAIRVIATSDLFRSK